MALRNINIDLLYISLSHILFLLKLYGMQYNIESNMHILKKCISNSRKIVMDIKYLCNVNSSEFYGDDTSSQSMKLQHNLTLERHFSSKLTLILILNNTVRT
jgi:hypothetical protein